MAESPVRFGRIAGVALTVVAVGSLMQGDTKNLSLPDIQDGRGGQSQTLLPCRLSVGLFPRTRSGAVTISESWEKTFARTVQAIVRAHLDPARPVRCDQMTREASEPLRRLAQKLPPWSRGAPLWESDMAAVLLTYREAYECSLLEYRTLLGPPTDSGSTLGVPITEQLSGTDREKAFITRELLATGDTVHRLLRFVSAYDRLKPVQTGITCFERASLDIRNTLSLAAEASACMDRQNGRASIRTLAP